MPYSKTDQEAEGAYLYLSDGTLNAVRRWLDLISVTGKDGMVQKQGVLLNSWRVEAYQKMA